MSDKYRVKTEGDSRTDPYIERISDGKRIADVSGDLINPTAPAYSRKTIMHDLGEVLAEYRSGMRDTTDGQKPVKGGEKPQDVEVVDEMPPVNLTLGDKCPKFIYWLTRTNPAEAERRYSGKGIEAYESIK